MFIPEHNSNHPLSPATSYVGDGHMWTGLPYHHTEKRAAAFFRGGRPFSRLDKKDKKTLERILKIRNAVAHQSRAARSEFDKIIASVPLLPAERTPPGFLRSVFALAPPRTHYQDIAGTCSLLARKLTR